MSENKRPQDELPYEVRMKYIIKDYRKINKHVDAARKYAEDMERENKELKEEIRKLQKRITAAHDQYEAALRKQKALTINLKEMQSSRDSVVKEVTDDLQHQCDVVVRQNKLLIQALSETDKIEKIPPLAMFCVTKDQMDVAVQQLEKALGRMQSIEDRIGIVEKAVGACYEDGAMRTALRRFSNAYGKIDSVVARINNFLDIVKYAKVDE